MALDVREFRRTQKLEGKGEKPEAPWIKWAKCAVVMFLYLLFLVWVGSLLGLVVVPFIYDAYITKKINWTWWKDVADDGVRKVMSWVDAIVFALVAVYFVNQFFFQNYQIPSSSLEKSLLTGDFLLVSKVSYGPRIPQTPLTLPLTQHTVPMLGCKSYIEWPHWEYRRVQGLGNVQYGDIVVFNYPSGDTVAVNTSADYYSLCFEEGLYNIHSRGYEVPRMDTMTVQDQRQFYEMAYAIGKKVVDAKRDEYGEVVTRPADRRENYVKRCVGLPGQTFQIKDKVIFIDGKEQKTPTDAQFNYKVYLKEGQFLGDDVCNELGISDEDKRNWLRSRESGMPLTEQARKGLLQHKELVDSIVEIKDGRWGYLYPLNHDYGWTRDNYGPIVIPAKGQTIKLTADNIAIYERPIRTYEDNELRIEGERIYINGKLADSYTFKMDYYWMMGDNRHNSADSRYWGFVPEDHVVGKPLFVWLSISPDANPSSRIRWDRFFKWVGDIK